MGMYDRIKHEVICPNPNCDNLLTTFQTKDLDKTMREFKIGTDMNEHLPSEDAWVANSRVSLQVDEIAADFVEGYVQCEKCNIFVSINFHIDKEGILKEDYKLKYIQHYPSNSLAMPEEVKPDEHMEKLLNTNQRISLTEFRKMMEEKTLS